MPVGGAAIKVVSEDILKQTKILAAKKLNIKEENIEYKEGIFTAEGTNLSTTIEELAKESEIPISASKQWTPPNYTFPNGCHVCELEVDKDTGQIELKNIRLLMILDK